MPPTALKSEPVRDPETGHAISPVDAAALCIKPRNLLTERQVKKVDVLKQGSDAFAEMRRLAMRSTGSFAARDRHHWMRGSTMRSTPNSFRSCGSLASCAETSMPSIMPSSCRGSNGQAEGQINRLKTLKRAMYGRAGPELLRARMLPRSTQRGRTPFLAARAGEARVPAFPLWLGTHEDRSTYEEEPLFRRPQSPLPGRTFSACSRS